MEASAAKNHETECRKIDQLLDLEDHPTISKKSEFDDYLTVDRKDANVTKEISAQVRLLQNRHSCRRKDLMTFSSHGKKFSHAVIRQLYEDVLCRIERGDVKLSRAQSIERIVAKNRSVLW